MERAPEPALALPDPACGVVDALPYQVRHAAPGRLVAGAREEPPRSPERVLVVGLSAVGSVVQFLPLVPLLRRAYPRARIDWVVQDKAREVVEGRDDLDRVTVLELGRWRRALVRPRAAASMLREVLELARRELNPHDLLLDPQGTAKSGLVNLASGVRHRVGLAAPWAREGSHCTTTHRAAPGALRVHRVRRALALLEALGHPAEGLDGRFRVPEEGRGAARRALERLGLPPGSLLLLHPGTSDGARRKRWPLARFVALAARARADLGLAPLLVAGPAERDLLPALAAEPGGALLPVHAPATLAELGGLLLEARAFLGGDSGPLHLASSLRVPTVGLFGPTDPVLHAPFFPPAVLVVKGLGCPRCGAPHCRHPVARMEAIAVEEALAALARVLGSAAATA